MIMAVDKPWDGSASRFTDEQYRKSCLVCLPDCNNPKSCCKLPVREPGGEVNKKALSAALASLNGARGGVSLPSELKKQARNKLKNLYKQAGMTMEAHNPTFNAEGKIWTTGIHNVYINGEPKRLKVPPETIIPTYQTLLELGEIPIGIDHLPQHVLEENEILRKMELDNVGHANQFTTDGTSIFMKEPTINNPLINDLGLRGELPSYSSIGPLKARNCEDEDADLILQDLKIKKVDFVERGGCKSCKVGEKPEKDLVIYAKLSMEENPMTEEEIEEMETTNEEVAEESEEMLETETTEEEVVETVEETEEEEETVAPEVLTKEDVESIVHKALEAKESTLKMQAEAHKTVEAYIKEGVAIPAEREVLEEAAIDNPELFQKMMAKRPKIIEYEQISQHVEARSSQEEEEEEEPEVDEFTGMPLLKEDEVKEMMKL